MAHLLANYYYFMLLLAAAVGCYAALRLIDRGVEPAAGAGAFDYRDPYLIAALRRGPKAVVELAIVSLLDRGLLHADDQSIDDQAHVRAGRADAADFAGNDVERALLNGAASQTPMRELGNLPEAVAAAQRYAERLVALGMKADSSAAPRRFVTLLLCLLPAILIVLLRVLAVEKGTFLQFALGALAISLAAGVAYANRDARGTAMLGELTGLFSGLEERARDLRRGRMCSDAMFCAATYGLWRLPASEFPAAAYFAEQEHKRDSGSSSSPGSGSCDSMDCGGSDGGDGGGGCGGGCGGG